MNRCRRGFSMLETMNHSGQQAGGEYRNAPHRNSGRHHGTAALAHCPLFCGIPTAEHAGLLAAARAKGFTRGDSLYVDGAQVEEVLLITSGQVKITKFGESGAVAILGLSGPGDVLGTANLLSTGMHTATAEPVQSCRILAWRESTFKVILQRFPILYPNMVRADAEYLRQLEERFREMASDMVSQRVARQLVRLHGKAVLPGTDSTELCLSHEELAQMTGTTLFSISRLLTEWEERGIVISRRQALTVLNVESLRAIFGCKASASRELVRVRAASA